MKKTLLYIMGIDWNWIYQRPQVLAEKLARDFDVTVVFPRSILKCRECSKVSISHRILWTIPYQEKNSVVGKASNLLNRKVFKDINDFDYVYIGYPQYARYIPQDYKGKIIYDCLDDFEKIYPDQKRVYKITEQEEQLIKRCDLLLASSEHLRRHVDAIAGYEKSTLLRNALKMPKTSNSAPEAAEIKGAIKKENYKLYYIGTIAEWMDFELLKKSCMQLPNMQYYMIGPAANPVECEGIHYEGIVEHAKLSDAIADCDCLVMPFVVNDIVLAVDPVKLYEYIAFGKCIVSAYYPEIERFGDFVYFYHTKEEYIALLTELGEQGFPPKYSKAQQEAFLWENTWDERYELLRDNIQKLIG